MQSKERRKIELANDYRREIKNLKSLQLAEQACKSRIRGIKDEYKRLSGVELIPETSL